MDRRRRPPLALPDRRRVRRALDLRALRARGPRGDGLGMPLHRRGHGWAPRGRPARGGRPSVPRSRPGGPGRDGRAAPERLRPSRAAGGGGLRARPALRLGSTSRSRRPRSTPTSRGAPASARPSGAAASVRRLHGVGPAQGRGRRSRIRITRAGIPPTTALAGTSLVTTELVPIDGVVAHLHSAEDARAVSDPDVRAHVDVALVDALNPDRALDLDRCRGRSR